MMDVGAAENIDSRRDWEQMMSNRDCRPLSGRRLLLAIAVALLTATPATLHAAVVSWEGQGGSFNWGEPLNWTGGVVPGASDDVRIGDITPAATTTLDTDFSIASLILSARASVSTSGDALTVSGDVTITDAGTVLFATAHSPGSSINSLTASNLSVENQARIDMFSSRLAATNAMTISSGSEIRGAGVLTADSFNNNGQLTGALSGSLSLVGTGTNSIDLDGSNETGIVRAVDGSFRTTAGLADDFNGTMTIGSSRRVFLEGGGTIGAGGVVNLNGSTFTAAEFGPFFSTSPKSMIRGALNVTGTGLIDDTSLLTGAAVNVAGANDRLVITGEALIESGVTFTGNGRIRNDTAGVLTLADDSEVARPLENQGELHIGTAADMALVQSFTQTNDGTLVVDLAGAPFGEYDRLTTTAGGLLDGQLQVNLLDGFEPQQGDFFRILSSSGIFTGAFDTMADALPALTDDLFWEIDYSNQTRVTLRVKAPPPPGDYNENGIVDAADYTIWRDTLGSTTELAADGNGDGTVNAADYDFWKMNFGMTNEPGGSGSGSAVPEPASAALLFLLAFGLLDRRRE